jgi:hypothetical protein
LKGAKTPTTQRPPLKIQALVYYSLHYFNKIEPSQEMTSNQATADSSAPKGSKTAEDILGKNQQTMSKYLDFLK